MRGLLTRLRRKYKRTILGREVVRRVYDKLDDIKPCTEVELPFYTGHCFNLSDCVDWKNLERGAVSLIGNDSDHHRIRRGYMRYPRVKLLELNNQTWAIGRGRSFGHYPADPYHSDLLAVRVTPKDLEGRALQEHVRDKIEYAHGEFMHSLIYVSRRDNTLVVPRYSVFSGFPPGGMRGALIDALPHHVPQEKETDTIIPFSLKDPQLPKGDYHSRTAGIILKAIEKVLRDRSSLVENPKN